MVQCSLVVLQCTLTGPFLFVLLTRGCVHVHAGCDKEACGNYLRIKFEKQGHFLLVNNLCRILFHAYAKTQATFDLDLSMLLVGLIAAAEEQTESRLSILDALRLPTASGLTRT